MQTKAHYTILDGLRGVAALAVLCYHLFEAVAFSAELPEQEMFHGFMAVDFFFILSGFVMGYAYDERWGEMSVGAFVRRRLIRLHPMVVMGAVVGLAAFGLQGCTRWDGSVAPAGQILLCCCLGLLLLPVPRGADVRGNGEMFPLNGPHWSLFFEYLGSLAYALLLRRMSTRWLGLWVGTSAALLLANALWRGEGMVAYGWASEPLNMLGGLARLSFGYPAGLLMARLFRQRKPSTLDGPVFLACSLVLLGLLSLPRMGGWSLYYQIVCIVFLFPLIIWTGARGTIDGIVKRIASFLGRLSYPLYAIHYPLIYLYIDWTNRDIHPLGLTGWGLAAAVALTAIGLGTLAMLLYDEPVRRRLAKSSSR